MKHSVPVLRTLALFALVTTLGCGDGLGRVSGTVSLGGEPITKSGARRCTVTFTPVSGGAKASGMVDESGYYRLAMGSKSGLTPGEYQASVMIRDVIPPKQAGGYPSAKILSPKRYANPQTSGLTFTVDRGGNRFDIELETGG